MCSILWALVAMIGANGFPDPLVVSLMKPLDVQLSRALDSGRIFEGASNGLQHEHFILSTILTHIGLLKYVSVLDSALRFAAHPLAGFFLIEGLSLMQDVLNEERNHQRVAPWLFLARASSKRIAAAVPWLLQKETHDLHKLKMTAPSAMRPIDFLRSMTKPQVSALYKPQSLDDAVRYVAVLAAVKRCFALADSIEATHTEGLQAFARGTLDQVYRLELRLSIHEIGAILSWLPIHNLPELQPVLREVERVTSLDFEPPIAEFRNLWLRLASLKAPFNQMEPLRLVTDALLLGLLDCLKVSTLEVVRSLRERQKALVFSEPARASFDRKQVLLMFDVFGSLADVFEEIAEQTTLMLGKVPSMEYIYNSDLAVSKRLLSRIPLTTLASLKNSAFWRLFLSHSTAIADVLTALVSTGASAVSSNPVDILVIQQKTLTSLAKLEARLGEAPFAASPELLAAMDVFDKATAKAVANSDHKIIVNSLHLALGTNAPNAAIPPDDLAVLTASMLYGVRRYFPEPTAATDVVVEALKRGFAMAVFDGLGLAPDCYDGRPLFDTMCFNDLLDRLDSKLTQTGEDDPKVQNFAKAAGIMRSYLNAADASEIRLGVREARRSLEYWREARRLVQAEFEATAALLNERPRLAVYSTFWVELQRQVDGGFEAGEVFFCSQDAAEDRDTSDGLSLSALAQIMLKLKEVLTNIGLPDGVISAISGALIPVVESLGDVLILDTKVQTLFPSDADIKKALIIKNLIRRS